MVGLESQASDTTAPTPHKAKGIGQRQRLAQLHQVPTFPGPAGGRSQTHPQLSQEAAIKSINLRAAHGKCTPAHSFSKHPLPHRALCAVSRSQLSQSDPLVPRPPCAPGPLSPVVPFAHTVIEPLAVVVEAAHALVAGTAVFGASAPAREEGAQRIRPPRPPLRLWAWLGVAGVCRGT